MNKPEEQNSLSLRVCGDITPIFQAGREPLWWIPGGIEANVPSDAINNDAVWFYRVYYQLVDRNGNPDGEPSTAYDIETAGRSFGCPCWRRNFANPMDPFDRYRLTVRAFKRSTERAGPPLPVWNGADYVDVVFGSAPNIGSISVWTYRGVVLTHGNGCERNGQDDNGVAEG